MTRGISDVMATTLIVVLRVSAAFGSSPASKICSSYHTPSGFLRHCVRLLCLFLSSLRGLIGSKKSLKVNRTPLAASEISRFGSFRIGIV